MTATGTLDAGPGPNSGLVFVFTLYSQSWGLGSPRVGVVEAFKVVDYPFSITSSPLSTTTPPRPTRKPPFATNDQTLVPY